MSADLNADLIGWSFENGLGETVTVTGTMPGCHQYVNLDIEAVDGTVRPSVQVAAYVRQAKARAREEVSSKP